MNIFSVVPEFRAALQRRAVVLVRQSSPLQVRRNTGSRMVQMDMKSEMVAWGWEPEMIDVVDAGGESGRGRNPRPNFDRLLEMLATGSYGFISVVKDDRFGRNLRDSAELFDIAREHGALIRIGNAVYNPARASDKLSLQVLAAIAEYENEARRLYMAITRLAKARARSLRISLPQGLIWADPSDPTFRAATAEAGLADWTDAPGHTEDSGLDGQRLQIFPFPDRELFDSCNLRLDWIRETGSAPTVIDRTAEPPWPRPGFWPHVSEPRTRIWHSDLHVSWEVRQRADMISLLHTWLRNPAVYGIYRYSTGVMEAVNTFPTNDK